MRDQIPEALAATSQPVSRLAFRSPWKSFTYLLHRSAQEPGRWQVTRLEDDVPTGHTTYDTPEAGEASICGRFLRGQTPIGDRTFVRVFPCCSCGSLVPLGPTCRDCGADPSVDEVPCPDCEGEGTVYVAVVINTAYGPRDSPWEEDAAECPGCHGHEVIELPYAHE